jgi:putative membrane protein
MNLSFLRRWAIGSVAGAIVFLVGKGVSFDSLYAACMIALLLGAANAALPHLISMMTFMRTVLTLGLATLIVNALLLHILQQASLGIHFQSFDAMLLIAIMISTISWFSTMAMDTPLQTK